MQLLPTLIPTVRRRILYGLFVIIFILAVGTVGFHLIEGWDLLESLYVTVQTITTVGYGDRTPTATAGRVFSIFMMLIGVGTVLYGLSVLAQSVIHTELLNAFGLNRKLRKMEKLRDHYIVCGAGRVGRRIIRNLRKASLPYVVIERTEDKTADLEDQSAVMIADATLEENLIRAGVRQAKGLATCLPDDADNVYVVLTARGLNENLQIVARAVEEQAEVNLIRAGANRVVAPTIIGSQSMARALLNPAVADFMESIVAETLDLVFEEIAISYDSPFLNTKLKDSNISRELGLIVVAIRRKSGELIFHPVGDTSIEKGEIVVGKAEAVMKFKEQRR
jgi:voltage-gated potassium channel